MSKKILHVIETAYRATLEEQDDPIIWITHAMKGAGGDLSVVLRGDAVNYAVKGQNILPLSFGAWTQTQPPKLERDIASLVEKGVTVRVVEDDAAERGLEKSDLLPGVESLKSAAFPKLLDQFDYVWTW